MVAGLMPAISYAQALEGIVYDINTGRALRVIWPDHDMELRWRSWVTEPNERFMIAPRHIGVQGAQTYVDKELKK